jgi:hypothetical protein
MTTTPLHVHDELAVALRLVQANLDKASTAWAAGRLDERDQAVARAHQHAEQLRLGLRGLLTPARTSR